MGPRISSGYPDCSFAPVYPEARFYGACSRLLRVTSAEAALDLLLTSSRVFEDVARTGNHGEKAWDMGLVVRRWDPEVLKHGSLGVRELLLVSS